VTAVREARRGFALITVLCVMSIASAVALAATLLGRDAFAAERNRIHLERALWRSVGCAARARASLDESLTAAALLPGGLTRTWRGLDGAMDAAPLVAAGGCALTLEAAGAKLDLNTASPEQLDRALAAAGLEDQAMELRDALIDWRAANGPLSSIRELERVRGFESPATLSALAALAGVDAGRISIPNAPAAVLSTVPGFTPAVVQRILGMRAAGQQIYDLLQVVGQVGASDAGEMMSRYPETVRVTTLDPDAWLLTSRARVDAGAAEVVLEQRLLRNGSRVVQVRSRVLP
jgi:type II secretory pathway component PulK